MNRARLVSCALASGLVLGAASQVLAHHSFVGQFDPAKPVTMTGAVTKIEWTNPHAFFHIDVQSGDGAAASWRLELGSPNTLIRYRWTRDTLKIGDVVTVEGYLARDGSNLANAKTVKFPNGSVVNAGSSSDLVETR